MDKVAEKALDLGLVISEEVSTAIASWFLRLSLLLHVAVSLFFLSSA